MSWREKDRPDGRRSLARTPTPFNLCGVPIKRRFPQIMKDKEEDHAKSPSRNEVYGNLDTLLGISSFT
jgi:hypothetical protein